MSPWNTPRLIGKVDDEEVFPSVSGTGVELPQMTVYMKFSDRVHLFFDRVHFFL